MPRAVPRARARAARRGSEAIRRSPASPSRRPSPPRRSRTAAPPAHPAPSARSALRRSTPAPSSVRGHLALDPRRVLLERARLGRELDDLLLPVERVLPPDVHVVVGDLDQVVTGTRPAA